jgi:hypothetical protein
VLPCDSVLCRTDMPRAFNLWSGVLHDFLATNREILIDRCHAMGAGWSGPTPPDAQATRGIPVFLDQLIKTRTLERLSENSPQRRSDDPAVQSDSELSESVRLHGRDNSRCRDGICKP